MAETTRPQTRRRFPAPDSETKPGDVEAVPADPLYTPPNGSRQQGHRWRVTVDYTLARTATGAACLYIDGRALTVAEAHELILDLQPAADQIQTLRQLMERDK